MNLPFLRHSAIILCLLAASSAIHSDTSAKSPCLNEGDLRISTTIPEKPVIIHHFKAAYEMHDVQITDPTDGLIGLASMGINSNNRYECTVRSLNNNYWFRASIEYNNSEIASGETSNTMSTAQYGASGLDPEKIRFVIKQFKSSY